MLENLATAAAIVFSILLFRILGKSGVDIIWPPSTGLLNIIWPPSGIAPAMMLLLGKRIWPGIFLGTALGELFLVYSPPAMSASNLVAAFVDGAGQVVMAVLAVWLIKRFSQVDRLFSSPNNVLVFFYSAGVSSLVSAIAGVTTFNLTGLFAWSDYGLDLFIWWMEDVFGYLLFGSLILTLALRGARRTIEHRHFAEMAFLLAGLVITTMISFGPGVFGLYLPKFPFLVLPMLIWAAMRFTPPIAAGILFLISALIAASTLNGYGSFISGDSRVTYVLLQGFLSLMIITTLLLNSSRIARDESQQALEEMTVNLRQLVDARTAELRESEERLRRATDATGFGLFDYYPQTGELIWSAYAKEHFGLPPDADVDYSTFLAGLHPDDLERVNRIVQSVLNPESGGMYEIEYRTIGLQDGKERWLEARGRVLFDEQGQPVRLIGGTLDITERKRIQLTLLENQRQLQERNQLLEGLYATAPAGIAVFDATYPYEVLLHNQVYQAFWDEPFRTHGMVGKSIPDYAPQAEESGIFAVFREVARTGRGQTIYDFPYEGLARGKTWWNWSLSPIYQDETLIAFGHLLIEVTPQYHARQGLEAEITERKRTEAELRDSKQQLQFVVENSPDNVFLQDRDLRYIWVTKPAYPLTREEYIGKTDFDLLPEDGARLLTEIKQRVLDEQRGTTVEVHLVLKGLDRDYEATYESWRNATGQVIGLAGYVRDITERKRLEQELWQLNESLEERVRERTAQLQSSVSAYKALVDNAPDIITRFDRKLRHLYVSPQAKEITGIPADDLIGKTNKELGMPRELERLWSSTFRKVLRTGKTQTMEFNFLTPDGVRSFSARVAPEIGPSGEVERLVAITRDVTGQKKALRAQEELSASLQERTVALEAANKEMEAFTYSVSHDLRAPLRAVDGFSKAILEDYADRLDEEGREYLAFIREGAQQMGKLIDDLLRLSRVGRTEMRMEPVNLSALVREVAEDLRRQEPDRLVEWRVEPDLTAVGDQPLLRIMLENLLGNAWKFTGKRPIAHIEFFATLKDGETVYVIRDNGAGFDMHYVDKIFAPFQRLHSADEFPGTGIGLAIVQRVINRHGGRVWAEGAVDQGATFYFTLPKPQEAYNE